MATQINVNGTIDADKVYDYAVEPGTEETYSSGRVKQRENRPASSTTGP